MSAALRQQPVAAPNGGTDLGAVDRILERIGVSPECALPILQALQAHYRYLPEEALRRVCEQTRIPAATLLGVASFYPHFRMRPMGEHRLCVCVGTACHVKGAHRIQDTVRRHLGIGPGDDTDPEGRFTVEEVACLGCCTLAPVVQIDGVTYGHLEPDRVASMVRDFLARGEAEAPAAPVEALPAATGVVEFRVGLGSCCIAGGSAAVEEQLRAELAARGSTARIRRVGCVGLCHRTPMVEVVAPNGASQTYAQVRPEDVGAIVRRHAPAARRRARLADRAGRWIDRLLEGDEGDASVTRRLDPAAPPVAAFLAPQRHIATEHCGAMDPVDLADYRRRDGYQALERVLETMRPRAVIDAVRASGLRGRGGAGYPSGVKWAGVRGAEGRPKYVICNGDEGDPGAFMDRMIMESYPFRIIEGLTIAAYAVGADRGYCYVRSEYPLAVRRLREALDACERAGLLGNRILGSDFSLHLHVRQGAGAFVCGEETALIASIEGRRGMPSLRPPYPAQHGLWGQPTLVSNCETFATVPRILREGPTAFAALGTKHSRGTKVFSLAGKVRRGGLVEVPMGLTIREIVEGIGGGVGEGRRFKAVQIGGPSGGCLPAALADTPVDYEALTEAGAMMGSGGLVVLDDTDCMVDVARYFLAFTQRESCGKCTPCRIGTKRMLEILDRLCTGRARPDALERLEQLARMAREQSLCGLGRTAPNPILTTLRYFRDEYEAHLRGECPTGKCRELVSYVIGEDCIGCTKCAQHCPVEAIPFTPYRRHEIDEAKCTRCDTCRQLCPANAITITTGPSRPEPAPEPAEVPA